MNFNILYLRFCGNFPTDYFSIIYVIKLILEVRFTNQIMLRNRQLRIIIKI